MQGRQPQNGQGIGMPDFNWLLGLAGGDNRLCQDTVVAFAGGGQASAVEIGGMNAQGYQTQLVCLTTVATAGDSCKLPQAMKGKILLVYNSTATSANLYASPSTNRATGNTDSINGGANNAAYALAANKAALFFCPRDGIWAAILTA